MAKFFILETADYNAPFSENNYNVLSDVYGYEGTLDGAVKEVARMAESYPSYDHQLVQVIPVKISRGASTGDTVVGQFGEVTATATIENIR